MYMTLHPTPLNLLIYEENFSLFFISATTDPLLPFDPLWPDPLIPQSRPLYTTEYLYDNLVQNKHFFHIHCQEKVTKYREGPSDDARARIFVYAL